MIRSNQTRQISHRRNALRIALCIAMTANTRLAVADSGFETQPQRCSNSSCELPVYPFPTVAEAIADNTQSPSRRAIVRLLGFTSNNKCKPYSGSGLPQVAQPPIAALRPLDQAADLMTPSLPTVTLAVGEDRLAQSLPDLSIQTDSCPDSCTTLSAVQQPMVPVNSAVIAANATRPVQAVQESISDSGKSTQDVVEALDLVNSLDDIVSPPVKPKASHPKATHPKATDFKDSIQVDYSSARDESTEGSGVRLSLSDRDQSATTTKAKAPQLVNTKQSLSLRTTTTTPTESDDSRSRDEWTAHEAATQVIDPEVSKPVLERLPQRLQPSEALATLPMPMQTPMQTPPTAKLSQLMPAPVENQPEGSTRRGNKPEAMKIRIEGEPVPAYTQPRQPLVPMLANATGRARSPEQVTSQQSLQESRQDLPVESAKTTPQSTEVASQVVNVTVRDSVSLQSAETIQALSVEHQDVCQVIQTGGKTYSVIGLQPGETRVAVITDSAGQRKVQIQQIKIRATQATRQNDSSIASDISQTIHQLYPRSKVRITTRGTQLVVGGSVDSESTAKKILGLVRKSTLTPVVDELQIK